MSEKPRSYCNFSIDANKFRNICNSIRAVNSESQMVFSEKGIQFLDLDQSHISMWDIKISPEGMNSFKFVGDHFNLIVDLDDLMKPVKNLKKNDLLSLSFSEKEILLTFHEILYSFSPNEEKDLEFEWNAMDNIIYPIEKEIKEFPFKNILKIADEMGCDAADFHLNEFLTIKLENEKTKMNFSAILGDKIDEKPDFHLVFAVYYLKMLIPLYKTFENSFLFSFKGETPLKVKFGKIEENIRGFIYLAPRVEMYDYY